ncbi:MAG: protein phosphatase 2C domain-containing protein [Candidatus Micrarchaeota archaeon]|nr:protein phosphatase 2C domain-containing protein [Candidatus Micrarchaeota archaeon]
MNSRIISRIKTPTRDNIATHLDGFLLPADRHAPSAALTLENNHFSFTARSVKSTDKRRIEKGTPCQDATFGVVRNGYLLAGVADGFYKHGHVYSERIAKKLIEHDFTNEVSENESGKNTSLDDILQSAVKTAIDVFLSEISAERQIGTNLNVDALDAYNNGGTTLTVMILLPDRRYGIAKIGDSEAYLISPEGQVRVILESPAPPYDEDLDEYLETRNLLNVAVSPYSPMTLSTCGGILNTGELALIASDGIGKNLNITVNPSKVPICVNGCEDLTTIVRSLGTEAAHLEDISLGVVNIILERIRTHGENRMRIPREDGNIDFLVPNDDDISLAMIGIKD